MRIQSVFCIPRPFRVVGRAHACHSARLEQQLSQRLSGGPLLDAEQFHSDHAALVVVVQDHPRLDFLGLDDGLLVEPQV